MEGTVLALLIERHADTRHRMASEMGQGFICEETDSSAEGIAFASSYPFDCVVLGNARETTQIQFIRELRHRRRWQPILAITAPQQRGHIEAMLNAGLDSYLESPYPSEILPAQAAALVRRSQHRLTSTMRIGSLVIDSLCQTVRVGEYRIPLTPIQYRLIEYLAAKKKQIVSYQTLAENCWGPDDEGGTSDMRVQTVVQDIRVRLKEPGVNDFTIRHVKGIGYCIESEVRLGSLTVYPDTRKVFVRGSELRLPPRQRDILVYLAVHQNRYTNQKTMLQENVFGDGKKLVPDNISQNIARMRRRLEKLGCLDFRIISSTRATQGESGYRLVRSD